MSAFVPDSHRSSVRVGGADLEFSHVSLFCFTLSNVAMAAYCSGAIDAQAELVVEMVLLALKTVAEIYFGKWGPDLLLHHLVMLAAFAVVQLPDFREFAYACVAMQTIHVPLFFRHCWVVLRRKERSFFKRIPAKTARKLLHSAFWPSWLIVVSFRAPFLLRAAADTLPSAAGWLYLGFAALVLYMDLLWTLESAISKSHGVVGPAISEPGGWPKGLNTVQPWAVWPVFVGLAAAIVLWRPP